ncbi:vacuolar-type H+-ATPase subunit I/STV1 [Sphingobium sp. OAS761]|nr:vacuolar-type H+-ATPase subunit I/STV1 [Sphingobium sp. OAS761]
MAFVNGGDGDTTNPGFLLNGSAAAIHQAHVESVKRREDDKERQHVIQQIIDQIEARNRQIAENLERIDALSKQETALDRHLADLREGRKAELDENGALRDKAAEQAVREYEKRYGVKVDRNDPDQIAIILQGIRDEKLRIIRENEDLAADNERDRKLAIDMGAKPESIPATVRTLETTAEGQRSVNSATAKLERVEDRTAVADTILSEDDRELGHAAVAGVDEGFDEVAENDASAMAAPKAKPPMPL